VGIQRKGGDSDESEDQRQRRRRSDQRLKNLEERRSTMKTKTGIKGGGVITGD
jgi:hypothetical protein